MPYKTTRRAFQRAARGQCVTEFHKERRKKRDQIASVLSELLFDSVILCWFTRGVGIVLILACFCHVSMLSLYFRQVASHYQLPSVLDLCFFLCVAQAQAVCVCFFVQTRLRTFAARLLYPKRGSDSVPSSCPCCSLQTLSSTQKEAQFARHAEIQTSLWGPMAG